MSVINQMLRDLQARQSDATDSQRTAVAGLAAASQPGPARRPLRWWIALGVLALALLAWAAWAVLPTTGSLPSPQAQAPSPPARAPETPPPTAGDIAEAAPAPAAVEPEISTVIGTVTPDGYRLELVLTAAPDSLPALESDETDGRIEFDGVGLRDDVSVPATASPLQSLTLHSEDGHAVLSYALAGPARVRFGRSDAQTRLRLEFFAKAEPEPEPESMPVPAETAAAGRTAAASAPTQAAPAQETPEETVPAVATADVKRPAPPSAAERAEAAYADAMDRLRRGDPRAAETGLREALQLQPGHRGALEALAGLLLREGRAEPASDLLASALVRFPGDPGLLQLYARSRHALNDVAGAVAVLEHGLATSRPDAGYYAFLAALYQQQRDYEGAAAFYGRALEQAPRRADWWAGLGIALEGQGDRQAALEAYRRALADAALAPRLRTYLNARVATLQ